MRILQMTILVLLLFISLTGNAQAQERCPEGNAGWCWTGETYSDGSAQVLPYSGYQIGWLASDGYRLLGGCVEGIVGGVILFDKSYANNQSAFWAGPFDPLPSFCAVAYTEPIPQPEEQFVPEPASILLLSLGLTGLVGYITKQYHY